MNGFVFIFVTLAGVIALVYVGYPALLKSGALGQRLPMIRSFNEPRVSVIVPAHNEERSIEAKIINLLAFDYPMEKVEIFVGSDGSTDATEQIARRYASSGVKLLASRQQCGKSGIQNLLVKEAAGDVLIFTDADCLVAPNALRLMVEHFADPGIGLITCRPTYSNSSQNQISRNESIYLRYESWIRSEESARGLLCVGSGSFFGIRRVLWRPLDLDVGDDFVLPLGVALAGFRNVLDETIHVETALSQTAAKSMFRLKMRIISKDLRGLLVHSTALNPFRTGLVAIGLWLHKLLRWFVPFFLLGLLVDNVFLLGHPIFQLLFTLQIVFYVTAICCWLLGEEHARAPWSIPLSFCIVNAAAFAGVLHFAAGKKMGRWRPVR